MKIDKNTKYSEYLLFKDAIGSDGKDAIVDASARCYIGRNGYYSLTIAQLAELMGGNNPTKWVEDESLYSNVFEEGLKSFIEQFIKLLERYTPKPTADEELASKACAKVGFIEGLLVFVRSYFGLHSFSEAESITLYDVLIAKRDSYNNFAFNKALHNLTRRKK